MFHWCKLRPKKKNSCLKACARVGKFWANLGKKKKVMRKFFLFFFSSEKFVELPIFLSGGTKRERNYLMECTTLHTYHINLETNGITSMLQYAVNRRTLIFYEWPHSVKFKKKLKKSAYRITFQATRELWDKLFFFLALLSFWEAICNVTARSILFICVWRKVHGDIQSSAPVCIELPWYHFAVLSFSRDLVTGSG